MSRLRNLDTDLFQQAYGLNWAPKTKGWEMINLENLGLSLVERVWGLFFLNWKPDFDFSSFPVIYSIVTVPKHSC